MRLTDRQILDIIDEIGPATLTQIYDRIMEKYPDQDRKRDRIGAMLNSLIRYRFLDYTDKGIYRYYYAYGTHPDKFPTDTNRARVSGFLTAQAPQMYSAREIAETLNLSVNQVRRAIQDNGAIKRAGTASVRYYVEATQC